MFKENINKVNRLKILIVEDDKTNQHLTKIYLAEKFIVDAVCSSEEAIKSVKKNHYDLILIDIILAREKNGIQTAKEIRKLPNYDSIPIVAMKAFEKSEIFDFFSSQDSDLYLEKTYLNSQLLEVIEKRYRTKNLNPERRE